MALKIEATTFESPITNGTQDVTIAGFGTVSAAIVIMEVSENASAETVGTAYDGLGLSIGFCDGTNYRSISVASDHGAATTDTARSMQSLFVDQISFSSAVVKGSATAAFITDGVRFTWGDTPEAHTGLLILIGGSDVNNVAVGTTTNNTSHVLGFRPSFVIGASNGETVGTRTGISILNLGIAVDDGSNTERLVAIDSTDGSAAADPDVIVDTNDSLCQLFSGTQNWAANMTIDADGFNTDNTMGTDQAIYLAIGLSAGASVAAGTFVTPTSTGNNSTTGVGFQPDALFVVASNATSVDTVLSNNVFGFGIGLATATTEYFAGIAEEQAADPTNNQTKLTATAIDLPNDDGTQLAVASLGSFDSDGFTLNYTTVPGSATYGWYLALKGTSVSGGTSASILDGVKIGDSVSLAQAHIAAVADGVLMGDSDSAKAALLMSLSDGAVIGDSASAAIARVMAISDGVTLGDSAKSQRNLKMYLAEGVTMVDAVDAVGAYLAAIQDGVKLSDVTRFVTATDIVGLVSVTVSAGVASVTIVGAGPYGTISGAGPDMEAT